VFLGFVSNPLSVTLLPYVACFVAVKGLNPTLLLTLWTSLIQKDVYHAYKALHVNCIDGRRHKNSKVL